MSHVHGAKKACKLTGVSSGELGELRRAMISVGGSDRRRMASCQSHRDTDAYNELGVGYGYFKNDSPQGLGIDDRRGDRPRFY